MSHETRNPNEFEEDLRRALLRDREGWERRLTKIRADRRRESDPLVPDFADQATQRENDETLDALDQQGRQEVEAIDAALERMRAGSFGKCLRCGEAIPEQRLRALPIATTCIGCAASA